MSFTGGSDTLAARGTARYGYLRELGIDVWVPRGGRASGRRPEPSDSAGSATRQDTTGVTAEPDAKAEPAATFDIRGFRIGGVLALIDASLWPHRRFFLDVALAMNGWQGDRREDVRFEWPQLLSADGGEDAAGRAFRAFVAAQSGDDGRILAVGKTVAGLLGEKPPGAVLAIERVVDGVDGRDLWRRVRSLP